MYKVLNQRNECIVESPFDPKTEVELVVQENNSKKNGGKADIVNQVHEQGQNKKENYLLTEKSAAENENLNEYYKPK